VRVQLEEEDKVRQWWYPLKDHVRSERVGQEVGCHYGGRYGAAGDDGQRQAQQSQPPTWHLPVFSSCEVRE
jgi:hypothetical protein